jgi:hypothetical protein
MDLSSTGIRDLCPETSLVLEGWQISGVLLYRNRGLILDQYLPSPPSFGTVCPQSFQNLNSHSGKEKMKKKGMKMVYGWKMQIILGERSREGANEMKVIDQEGANEMSANEIDAACSVFPLQFG